MSLALLRLCRLALPLLASLLPCSSCCTRQPLVCNRQSLVLSALLRLKHHGRLTASSEWNFCRLRFFCLLQRFKVSLRDEDGLGFWGWHDGWLPDVLKSYGWRDSLPC